MPVCKQCGRSPGPWSGSWIREAIRWVESRPLSGRQLIVNFVIVRPERVGIEYWSLSKNNAAWDLVNSATKFGTSKGAADGFVLLGDFGFLPF